MCLGLFATHSSEGGLNGLVCVDVHDMLGTGDDVFEPKLKELSKLVGFGSMFDHCGRQYGKHASGEITISIKANNSELEEG